LVEQKEKRWANRLAEKSVEDPTRTFFTLKTHFNEAWKYLNVQELESRVTAQWKEFNSTVVTGKRKREGDVHYKPSKRRIVNIGLSGLYPGQTRLRVTQEDGTDVVPLSVFGQGVTAGTLNDWQRKQELKWTQQWTDTGKFLVSRRKNTQLWDITRGWNRTVWDLYMDKSGMYRPFDPLYEGYVMSDAGDE
jgi:hypothetical protein